MRPIDSSNIKTYIIYIRKIENLICIGWDRGKHEARVKAILIPGEAGHISQSQSSICIATSCKTMSIYPYTACMYCCSDLNNPAKQVKPNLVSTVEAWIPEKQFHEFATLACPACLAHVLWGQFNKFSADNAVGHSIQFQSKLKLLSQDESHMHKPIYH